MGSARGYVGAEIDLKKRSLTIAGHRTSILLEDEFWEDLLLIAKERGQSLAFLVQAIDQEREVGNLASAIRLYVRNYWKNRNPYS